MKVSTTGPSLHGDFIIGVTRLFLPNFPYWSVQLHPAFWEMDFVSNFLDFVSNFQFFSFCIYFSLLFLSQPKSTWKIKEKIPARTCQIPFPFCQMFYELNYLHNWINFYYKHSSCVCLGNTVVKNDSRIPYRTIPQKAFILRIR